MLNFKHVLTSITLTCSAVREEVSSLETRFAFGASLDLDLLGIQVDDKTLIPGLAVASSRAKPLAGLFSHLVVGEYGQCQSMLLMP